MCQDVLALCDAFAFSNGLKLDSWSSVKINPFFSFFHISKFKKPIPHLLPFSPTHRKSGLRKNVIALQSRNCIYMLPLLHFHTVALGTYSYHTLHKTTPSYAAERCRSIDVRGAGVFNYKQWIIIWAIDFYFHQNINENINQNTSRSVLHKREGSRGIICIVEMREEIGWMRTFWSALA